MKEKRVEGVAISKLIGADKRSVIGWVYRWSSGELAVFWDCSGPQRASRCEPELSDAEKREIDFERWMKL